MVDFKDVRHDVCDKRLPLPDLGYAGQIRCLQKGLQLRPTDGTLRGTSVDLRRGPRDQKNREPSHRAVEDLHRNEPPHEHSSTRNDSPV